MTHIKKLYKKLHSIKTIRPIALILTAIVCTSLTFSFPDVTTLITGKVFIDSNGNGKPEESEKGVANALITDGNKLIRTDEKGFFKFQSTKGSYICLSLPPGLEARESHFYLIKPQLTNYDFAVVKDNIETKKEKTLIFMADLHIKDEPFIKESLKKVADRVNQLKPEAIFLLGDLVHEVYNDRQAPAERKFNIARSFLKKLSSPYYCLLGNNDVFGWNRRKLRKEGHPLYGKKMFEKFIGPRYYSINIEGFHIVALDDIQGKQKSGKMECLGWIDETQLKWLEEDLRNVPPDTHLIILSHIPYLTSIHSFLTLANPETIDNMIYFQGRIASGRFVANFDQLSTLLKSFNRITFIAGHLHLFEKGSFEGKDRNINFFICGSVGGAYWRANMKSLKPLTTTFTPGIMVATCKNSKLINVRYETFDFFNEPSSIPKKENRN